MGKSYTASTISISLLLLLLGVVGYFTLGATKATKDITSGIRISVFLDDDITTEQRAEIERQIRANKDIQGFSFVNSDDATRDFTQSTGIVVDTNLGSNPIPSSYEITPVSLEAISGIEQAAAQWSGVTGTFYPKDVTGELDRKIGFVGQVGIYVGILLLFVALAMIYYTLKLSILNSADAIRTMQLVGAKNSFIKRPYIKNSVIQGFVAAIIAGGLLVLFIELFSATMNIPLKRDLQYWKQVAMIVSALCVAGVAICTFFTIIVLGVIVKNKRR